MTKKNKVATPDWILEGYDSKADYEKAKQATKQSDDSSTKGISQEKKMGKSFKIRECPKCGSDDVGVVLSNSDSEVGGGKEWECRKCKWVGTNVNEKELAEDELLKYLDSKGEEVA